MLQDGKTICTLENPEWINPVYAMFLMAQKLSEEQERMLQEDAEPRTE